MSHDGWPARILGTANAGRDALMAAALRPSRAALHAWREWQRSGSVDAWDDPIAIRWLPLIGWNVKDVANDRERAAFQDVWRRIWASNRRLMAGASPALETLMAAGIRVLVLKGAALAWSVYDTPALRPIGDVDILVAPHDLARARSVLEADGWVPLRTVREADVMTRHALDYRKPPHGALDLHWHLHHECCWADADAAIWQRAVAFPGEPAGLLMLGPADQLLQTCIHGLRWSPVHAAHWIADVAHIVRRAGASLDWQVVIDEARRRRMSLQVREALHLAADRARLHIPAGVFHALDSEPASWRDRAELHVKVRPVQSAGGMFLLWCGWSRLRQASGPPTPGFLRFLGAAAGVDSLPGLVPWMARHASRRLRNDIIRTRRSAATHPSRIHGGRN